MANNKNKQEAYHEIPSDAYIFIAGAAIHKNFFLFWTLFSMISTSILIYITFYTTFWATLGANLWDFFIIQHWQITLPFGTIMGAVITVTGYFWNKTRILNKQRRREEQERARRLDTALKGR